MPFVTDRLADQSRCAQVPAGGDEELAEFLSARIRGQQEAVRAIVRAATVARAGLAEPHRPLGSILLVGPTGVGKSELARTLAHALRGDPEDLCRIDMSQMSQEHYAASFGGAPPGYSGSKEGHTLFDRSTVEGDPYTPGVVLFDEIEKAHRVVLRSLLHVLDHGELVLANGQERIDFRNSYVILTSNLGARSLTRLMQGPVGRLQRRFGSAESAGSRAGQLTAGIARRAGERLSRRAVQSFLDPEFFNRIDEMVVLEHLDGATAESIVELQVQEIIRRARRRRASVTVDPSVHRLLLAEGFSPAYGARSLSRAVRRHLSAPLADAMRRARQVGETKPVLHVVCEGEEAVVYRRTAPEEEPDAAPDSPPEPVPEAEEKPDPDVGSGAAPEADAGSDTTAETRSEEDHDARL